MQFDINISPNIYLVAHEHALETRDMHITASHALVNDVLRLTCITQVMQCGVVSGSMQRHYLSLHEFRMALVDLHLLEFILPVIRVQQAAGL